MPYSGWLAKMSPWKRILKRINSRRFAGLEVHVLQLCGLSETASSGTVSSHDHAHTMARCSRIQRELRCGVSAPSPRHWCCPRQILAHDSSSHRGHFGFKHDAYVACSVSWHRTGPAPHESFLVRPWRVVRRESNSFEDFNQVAFVPFGDGLIELGASSSLLLSGPGDTPDNLLTDQLSPRPDDRTTPLQVSMEEGSTNRLMMLDIVYRSRQGVEW